MPVQPYTITRVLGENDLYGYLFTWTLNGGDTGQPVDSQFTGYIDRSVQTVGAVNTLNWEGSNDGVNYGTLNDPFGNTLTISDTKPHGVTEAVAHSRPNNISGSSTTVTLFARRGLR